MKPKNESLIKLLNKINEDTIARNSARRYELMTNVKKVKKKRFIPIIAIAAAVAILLSVAAVILVPLLTPGQVPIYTGMSVLHENTKGSESAGGIIPLSAIAVLDNDNHEGNNGNHGSNNPNKKPIEDIIDKELTTDTEAAETTDEGTLEVIPENELYYAKPNEDIFITIHFENPDEYKIMSFKLNGKAYADYMFEYGSDYENIIIKVNVGDVEGLIDYTIDAIQYADRETLKYVEMQGDPTLTIGVATAKQPVAEITDEAIDINEMSFKIKVTDELELIKLTEGKLYAVITDGNELIESKEIKVSELTDIKFENLKTSTYYQYAIVAEYDALDGEGFKPHVIYSKEITTREVVAFTEVTPDKTSINFSILFNENAETKEITAIELYLGENKVKDIDITTTEITDLLSNNEYRIVVSYTNKGATESISYTVKTLAKETPTLELAQKGESTQTSFEFDLVYTDPDSVGKITKLELLHGEDEPINVEDLSTRTFTELLSNNEYTVRVTFVYDLNDGEGEHTETVELAVKTLAKTSPTLVITQKGESTQTSFEFELTYTDIDAIGEITKLELLHGEDEPINVEDLNTRTFTELLSNNEYTVKVTFVYDLNDGKGEQTSTEELTVKTLTKVAPQIGFKIAKENKTSIEYLLSVIDPDGVYSQVDLYITDADGNRLSNQATENIFSGLTPATRYYIILKYSYDLNDGNGVHEEEIKNFSITDINPEFISATNLTDRINSGESVTATFKFSEIENVKIKAITINGQKVTLSKASNTYVATFIPDISGGKYDFKITAIEYEIFDITKTHICNIDTGVSVVVFGEIKIVGVSLSNGKNYIESGENGVVGYIDFEDSEGYTVTSFRCQEEEFTSNYKTVYLTKVTDTRYSFSVPYNESAIIFELNYEIEADSTTKSGYSVGFSFYSFDTTNITEISTPEQLMAITETGKYKLTADINMTGYEWIPKNFDGYLDGNGYKIENLVISPKFVTPEGDYRTDAYCAMFAKMGGVLRNIELTNVTINYTTPDIPIYDAYVAALAGYNSGIIINCNVSGDFYLLDFNESQYMMSYTAAVCGRSFGIIDSCTYNGTVISQYNISFGEICAFSERYDYWLIKETCTGNCEIIILNDE